MFGGKIGTTYVSDIWHYKALKNQWTLRGNLNDPRSAIAVGAVTGIECYP